MIELKEDSLYDIDKLDEYFAEYMSVYDNYIPFTTPDNYPMFLKDIEKKKKGIENLGVKEIFYFAYLDEKIIGSCSLRLNPEVNEEVLNDSGHIMYGVVPRFRRKGFGTKICKLLLEEAKKYNLTEVIITCLDTNIASIKVIENNNGILIEKKTDINGNLIRRYKVKTIGR